MSTTTKQLNYIIKGIDGYTGVMIGLLNSLDKVTTKLNSTNRTMSSLAKETKKNFEVMGQAAEKESAKIHKALTFKGNFGGTGGATDFLQNMISTSTFKPMMMLKDRISGWSESTISNISAVTAAMGAFAMATGLAAMKMEELLKHQIEVAKNFELERTVLKFNLANDAALMAKLREQSLFGGGLYGPLEMVKAQTALAAAGFQGYVNVLDEFGKKVKTSMVELGMDPALNLATMTRGLLSVEKTAEIVASIYQKTSIKMEDAIWHEGKMITGLTRFNDMIAKAAISFSFKPEQIATVLDSMRTAMSQLHIAPETALSMVGMLMTGGMSTAEASQRLTMLARQYTMMAGKIMGAEMNQELAQIRNRMTSWGKEIDIGMNVAGAQSNIRGKRQIYWYEKAFGTVAEFEKFMSDSENGLVDILDFYSMVEKKVSGMTEFRKYGFLNKLLGGSENVSAFLALQNYKTTLDKDVYKVDNWGRMLDASGKITYNAKEATILWKAFDEHGQSIVYKGLEAMRVQRDSLRDSLGVAKSFTDMLEKTFWGKGKMWQAAKDTFALLIGEPVIEALGWIIPKITSALQAFNKFLDRNPFIKNALGYGMVVITAVLGIFAALSAVFGVLAFAGFIFTSGFTRFKEILGFFKIAGETLAPKAVTGVAGGVGARILASTGLAGFFGKSMASAWGEGALIKTLSLAGSIVGKIATAIWWLTKFFGNMAIGYIFFNMWINIIDKITSAFVKQGNAIDKSMSAIERVGWTLSKLAAVMNFLSKAFMGQDVTGEEVAAMGDFGTSALGIMTSNVFLWVAGFFNFLRELDKKVAAWIESGGFGNGISLSEQAGKRAASSGLGAFMLRKIIGGKTTMLGMILGGFLGDKVAIAGLMAESATGSSILGFALSTALMMFVVALFKGIGIVVLASLSKITLAAVGGILIKIITGIAMVLAGLIGTLVVAIKGLFITIGTALLGLSGGTILIIAAVVALITYLSYKIYTLAQEGYFTALAEVAKVHGWTEVLVTWIGQLFLTLLSPLLGFPNRIRVTALNAFGFIAGKLGNEELAGSARSLADELYNNSVFTNSQKFDPYDLNKEFKETWNNVKDKKDIETKNSGGNTYYDVKVINPVGINGIEDAVKRGINESDSKAKNLEYMRMGDTSIMGGSNKNFLDNAFEYIK